MGTSSHNQTSSKTHTNPFPPAAQSTWGRVHSGGDQQQIGGQHLLYNIPVVEVWIEFVDHNLISQHRRLWE